MNKSKIYELLFSTIKDEARLYKYYIKNIMWTFLSEEADLNNVGCSAWVSTLAKPGTDPGFIYKCNHVFFNLENKKELIRTSCTIIPNKNTLRLVIKFLLTKSKKIVEIQALNESNEYYEMIKADYFRDKNNINYSNHSPFLNNLNNDDDYVEFAKTLLKEDLII